MMSLPVIMPSSAPHASAGPGLHRWGDYLVLGTVKNPLLLNLATDSRSKFRSLSKNSSQKYKGIILDGERMSLKRIKNNYSIQDAIRHSLPIIMSRPTKDKVNAITGLEVGGSEAMVMIPKKNGEEFEIYEFGSQHPKNIRPLSKDVQPFVNAIHRVVNNHQPEVDTGNPGEESINPHRRWTVLPVEPTIWGKQSQWIHVGFQYDLYYVCDPQPARKYLLMRTIGNGVSSGKLCHDNVFRRGYYQNKVLIDVQGYPHSGWTGSRLKLEEYAPQSENTLNMEQSTRGILFSLSGIAGIASYGNTAAGNSGVSVGISLYDQHSVTSKFDDFTVSFLPTATSDRWEFWMNGADGSKVRKKHQTWDLITNRYGICTLRELPQLASESVLQPDVQALYYTQGNQKGKWTITGTVKQHLQDVTSWLLFGRTKKISKALSKEVTIDFSLVNGDGNEKCRK